MSLTQGRVIGYQSGVGRRATGRRLAPAGGMSALGVRRDVWRRQIERRSPPVPPPRSEGHDAAEGEVQHPARKSTSSSQGILLVTDCPSICPPPPADPAARQKQQVMFQGQQLDMTGICKGARASG